MKFTIILSIILFNGCSAQNKIFTNTCPTDEIAFINNKSLDFSIVMMSCDTCAPIKNIGYRVITNISELQEKIIMKITKDCWLSLLQNEKTDWAANLILYNIHNRDALLLSRSDEKDWKRYLKKEDIKYWLDKSK